MRSSSIPIIQVLLFILLIHICFLRDMTTAMLCKIALPPSGRTSTRRSTSGTRGRGAASTPSTSFRCGPSAVQDANKSWQTSCSARTTSSSRQEWVTSRTTSSVAKKIVALDPIMVSPEGIVAVSFIEAFNDSYSSVKVAPAWS